MDFAGVALIILCVGVTVYIIRRSGRGHVETESVDSLGSRLESIESRITDTQDVMIALAEKYDHLEERYRGQDESKEV